MWFVKKSEILSMLPCDCLDEILPIFSSHHSIKKNTMIYRPEDPSEYVYLLKKGSVRLMRLTEDGRQITLSIIREGMIFGEGDVLNEDNYSHYAQTMQPSMFCYIRKEDFKNLLSTYEQVNRLVLNILYRRWKDAQQQIENLALHDTRDRLVSILIRFSEESGKELHSADSAGLLIDMKISQDKLSDFIGTSRESVNRNMRELKKEGLIDMYERKILLKPAFLERYMNRETSSLV
ncbi:Crp/Fnr family transcriptional regulator [Paenibacillus alkalitolerans]|uniref:Crp/Fnr family transcriptional regulator n=1 Tax=Paenibacillus alkalitolerans TaxID=2799335 RepID=UPI0018F54594|nr:Crp/Fnr family transcriptional regulator [Paenibacillus alkalitolerans]